MAHTETGRKTSTAPEDTAKTSSFTAASVAKRSLMLEKIMAKFSGEIRRMAQQNSTESVNSGVDGTEGIGLLVHIVNELERMFHIRLHYSPRIEYLYTSALATSSSSPTSASDQIEELKTRYAGALDFREERVAEWDERVTELEKHLSTLERNAHEKVMTKRQETREELELMREESQKAVAGRRADLLAMQEEQQRQEEEHRDLEMDLRRERCALRAEAKVKVEVYDKVMTELQAKVESCRAQNDLLLHQIDIKTAELEAVTQRFRIIEEERVRKEEARLAEMQLTFRREHAARIIQRAWHHYKMKKMLKKAQRRGKKKKGKEGSEVKAKTKATDT